MTELAGQCLLVLAVLDVAGTGRWHLAAAGQNGVLALFAVLLAVQGAAWPEGVVAAALAGCAVLAGGRPASSSTGRPTRVLAAALAAVLLTVPVLAQVQPSPGFDILSAAVPVAAAGLVLVLSGRRGDGGATLLRAAVFASLAGPGGGVATLPLAAFLLAVEARGWPSGVFVVVRRPAVQAGVAAAAVAYLLVALAVPGLPGSAAILGVAAAGAAVHLIGGPSRPGVPYATGLPLAALGAGLVGVGPPGLADGLLLAGLALGAGGLLRLARARPAPALLALLAADASIWLVRGVPAGLPVGLAATSWAALLLLGTRPGGRAASDAAILHGGVALCAAGLGTTPALQAGVVHVAGFALAQAGAWLAPRGRWPATLALAALPPSALFVSEFLLLRAAGRWFWPLAAVLALAACAFLRRLPRHVPAPREWRAWTPLAASALLGAAAWATAP